MSLFEITKQSIGCKKKKNQKPIPSLWKPRLACQRGIQQAHWHLTSLIYAETIVSTSQPPGPEFPALPIDGWRWPRSMLVHIIIISLRGEGGNGDQWGSDLPLCAHLLQSQIINWFISPPLPSVLFRGLSEGVHYLFMERSFIQFAGNPIRSSVWMYGEGPQGQVNYSIIFNAWDGHRCQGPGWIYLAL